MLNHYVHQCGPSTLIIFHLYSPLVWSLSRRSLPINTRRHSVTRSWRVVERKERWACDDIAERRLSTYGEEFCCCWEEANWDHWNVPTKRATFKWERGRFKMSVVNQFIINCKADKQEYLPSSDYGCRMNQWVVSKSHIFQIEKKFRQRPY